ncbi:ABC transporter substrate-binding protein [Rugosimonospora acidiphila]|uniref:ABC transporter substrate-binding protein n=1 Tax=Rugosimonospora acidiphila TaxID=556531 RepID=A0ABP9SRF8_9ACTN
MSLKRGRILGGVAALAALVVTLAACGSGGDDSGAKTITVGTSGATGVYLPLYVGVQTGIFKKYGLNVKLQTLTPAAVTAAVLSNNINIGWDGPGLVSGIITNPSAKVIFTAGPTVFYLYGKKGLTSINDLKGKSVAVTTPGGAIDGAVRAAITKAGMKPGVDVKVAYLQTNSAALAAVQTGSVAAAGVSPPTSIQADEKGMVNLEDITALAPPSVLAVNDKFAKSNGPTVTKFITAFKAAVKEAGSNAQASGQALKTYVKLTAPAEIDGTYQAYKTVWTVGPYPTDQMDVMLQQFRTATPPVKGVDTVKISSLVDNEYVNAAA